jgi:serpin B
MNLSDGNNLFALKLYQSLTRGKDGNLFFSPFSISLALAMAYAGACGETGEQMAAALHFELPPEKLHPAFGQARRSIEVKVEDERKSPWSGSPVRLKVANGIWGLEGYEYNSDFLKVLAEHYNTDLKLRDFVGSPEKARREINDWVSKTTEDKIRDLIPPGGINTLTRIVLANAIYFYGSWAEEFWKNSTEEKDFTLLDGEKVKVSMMKVVRHMGYHQGAGYQAVSVPYLGERFSMFVILPELERFGEFENGLDANLISRIQARLKSEKKVELYLPKFGFDSSFSLKEKLVSMGMTNVFAEGADFSGIASGEDIFLHDVFHKAFIAVDEKGTEAAAATSIPVAAAYGGFHIPEKIYLFNADHPFIFLIHDSLTETILFLGRMLDPR